MTRANSLLQELAVPVVRNYLPLEQAHAAVAARLLREERLGVGEGDGSFEEKLNIEVHLLNGWIARLENERRACAFEIDRAVWPMIDRQYPRNQVRAQAHDVNAELGFPFAEPEIEGVLIDLLHRALARARRGNGR